MGDQGTLDVWREAWAAYWDLVSAENHDPGDEDRS